MKSTGKILYIRLDAETRKPIVTLEINSKQELLCNADELTSADTIDIELKKHRNKRSLSANAYAWVLLDKLSEVLHISKETIYKNIVHDIGGNTAYISVSKEATKKLLCEWEKHGIGWFGEIITDNGVMNDVCLYYGSSTYDTKQMARLIELIVQECKEQNIATETMERIAKEEGLLEL